MVIGSPIWYYAWRLLLDALPDPDDKESYLRLGLLYLLTLGGVIVFLVVLGLYTSFSMAWVIAAQIVYVAARERLRWRRAGRSAVVRVMVMGMCSFHGG